MITYEYKCTKCDHEFEESRLITEDTKRAECPECTEEAVRHFRTPPKLDTYYPGSFKDEHPVPGI